MRTRSMLKIACIFALVALTPSPAFAEHVVQNIPGPGEQSTQDNAQLEAQASLSKLQEIITSLSPNVGSARRLTQDDGLGDLVQSVVSSIPNLGGGSFNPLGSSMFGGGGLGSNLFGGSSLGSNMFGGGGLGSNLFGGSSLGSAFGGGGDGDGLRMPSFSDILGSDTPFSTGAFLLDTKNATVPASLSNMLKTTDLSEEEAAVLGIVSSSFFLTSAICFTVFGGLLIGAFSGLLFSAGLGLITGPYGWSLSVRQTWNNVLSSRNSAGENTKLWTNTLTKTAERINNLNTGSLKQELAGLRGQLGNVLNLLSAVQSRFT